jgi:hypothetical protein
MPRLKRPRNIPQAPPPESQCLPQLPPQQSSAGSDTPDQAQPALLPQAPRLAPSLPRAPGPISLLEEQQHGQSHQNIPEHQPALNPTNEHFLPSCPPDNHSEIAEDITEEESAFESDDSAADKFSNEEYNWHDNSDEECDASAQAFDLDDRAQLEAAYDRFGFGLLYELSADELLHNLHYQVKITKNVSYEVHQL